MTTVVPELDAAPDWTALRAHRSPLWRPGMNTQFEPWVALAETNTGHLMVPCGRDADRAREIVARWHLIAQRGDTLDRNGHQVIYGAAVVDPRGELDSAWKLERVGSVPDPHGLPRWTPLTVMSRWGRCLRCSAERWPGCYVAVRLDGCAECLPATETDDPRQWPPDPDRPAGGPPVAAKPTKKR
jgi:hypothetical protein